MVGLFLGSYKSSAHAIEIPSTSVMIIAHQDVMILRIFIGGRNTVVRKRKAKTISDSKRDVEVVRARHVFGGEIQGMCLAAKLKGKSACIAP